MSSKPPYFEKIREEAAQNWEILEQRPDLAGPWHQLFKQVQSPRHVLSELLQNADDANATEASVRVQDGIFVFEHNGEDFTEENFASLCRFGYSNKRALHTIGFRGIGFKSTFSLGDRVELYTPTLACVFERRRFTEPRWSTHGPPTAGKTCIRVVISDQHRQTAIEKNLEDWLRSPVSLLFFRHIRRIQIGKDVVHWGSLGPGPLPDSEWMALYDQQDDAYLLLRSDAEPFPDDALSEIRQERMLAAEEETAFPPCKVEIVLGAAGRLFVVLPTGVETELPFACNAPFIANPDRDDIKDPGMSATNRWLLERAGKLAATAMLNWLGETRLSTIERSRAYGLFPDVDRQDGSLEGVCGTIVEEAFDEAIDGQRLLMTEEGDLTIAGQSVILPKEILDVWPAEQSAALFDEQSRPALSQHIETGDKQKLVRWGLIEEISKQNVLGALRTKHLPRPKTWKHLLHLWAYIAPEITGYRAYVKADDLRIVPVQGKDVLYAASEVVRLGEKKLLQSEDDWEFIGAHLVVLNQNWTRFLSEQRRVADERGGRALQDIVGAAHAVLQKMGLEDTSDVNKVVERVASEFFSQKSMSLSGCVQLAQIAAKLGATAGAAFRYVTKDRHIRPLDAAIMFDEDGALEDLVPQQMRDKQLLHPDYGTAFKSCTQEEWQKWVSSGRAGVLTFIPLIQKRLSAYGKAQIEQEVRKRGLEGDLSYPYVTSQFVVEDWDFDEVYWRHWTELAAKDQGIWCRVADRLLSQRDTHWSRAKSARALQRATTGNERSMTYGALLPSWAVRFRNLPCLPDTRGVPRKPGDLLRRTPETECLMDVEPFVHGLLDRETTRPLLDLLGVRNTPTGPARLLDFLRALGRAETPPVQEVEKWYRRLDQMIGTCSTADFLNIKKTFHSEKIILTQEGVWTGAAGVFLSSDEEDVPGAAIIRASVADLTLWRKIGIEERPTVALALQWLKGLPTGQVPSPDDTRRVRLLLARYPVQIWNECRHWLNLAGEWAPVGGLSYTLTMQSLVAWRHLHQWVRQQIADLQRLPAEVTGAAPFADLPPLAAHVEDRFHLTPLFTGTPKKREWLVALASELRRIELEAEPETQRVRSLAESLANTNWQETPGLEIIPYIKGTPAGTPRRADVVWLGEVLYVDALSKAKLAKRVPEEIGKAFNRSDIKAALDYSFERSPDSVREYLQENFTLSAYEITPSEQVDGVPNADASNGAGQPFGETDTAADDGAESGEQQVLSAADASEPEQEDLNGVNVLARRPTTKPHKPSIIERFARTQGFKKDSDERFFHPNGSWICRANGARFPWERRDASGELERFYLPKDHCLELEPLQLEADVWWLIDEQPEKYALILSDPDGAPVEVTGTKLRTMRDQGEITFHPATYRIVYSHDKHA